MMNRKRIAAYFITFVAEKAADKITLSNIFRILTGT